MQKEKYERNVIMKGEAGKAKRLFVGATQFPAEKSMV